MPKKPKRILLKISGEALLGKELSTEKGIINKAFTKSICQELLAMQKKGKQIAIVVGGGNIFRGAQDGIGHDPAMDHFIGMTATIASGLLVQEMIRSLGGKATTLSALPYGKVCDLFTPEKGRAVLDRKEILLCVGGSGNPFCTTDFAAALRAAELHCDLLIKATKVDGVYNKDPMKHKNATKYTELSFKEAIKKNLRVMDQIAFGLCQEEEIPIRVFNLFKKGNLTKALKGESLGTLVSKE